MEYITIKHKNQDYVCIVDKDDYIKLQLGEYSWHLANGYARCRADGEYILMHRLILGAAKSPGRDTKIVVDHINRNKLDNRKANIRLIDRSQNAINSNYARKMHSEYPGVSFNKTKINKKKPSKPWTAIYKGKQLGYFSSEIEAYEAWCKEAY